MTQKYIQEVQFVGTGTTHMHTYTKYTKNSFSANEESEKNDEQQVSVCVCARARVWSHGSALVSIIMGSTHTSISERWDGWTYSSTIWFELVWWMASVLLQSYGIYTWWMSTLTADSVTPSDWVIIKFMSTGNIYSLTWALDTVEITT
jgi:hypothetical protein